MTTGTITILGCGNSTGVPSIGNNWGACDPEEPKNARTRSSIAVQSANTTIIIDTGPDFRTQFSRENLTRADAVFYTHQHSDHVNGMDELRILYNRQGKTRIPCYGNDSTMTDLQTRFPYLFSGGDHNFYPPVIEPHIFKARDFGHPHTIGDIDFIPFDQDHGTCRSVGYRFGDFAYSVDIWTLDEKAVDSLRGIKTWLVDAAAYHQDSNPVHANLETIYALNEQIGAKQVYLTSLSLAMDYRTLCAELPKEFAPAYDGMRIAFEG